MYLRKFSFRKQYIKGADNQTINIKKRKFEGGKLSYICALCGILRRPSPMIIEAEIISQPYSGEYPEKIYDNESSWNSQSWTFVKFTNDDFSEWCGHFRGFPRHVAISKTYNAVLVLTSDYLFQLDSENGNLLELEDQPQYQNLTVDPNGNFILADYYHFEKVTNSIKNKEALESPVQMDMIEFNNWVNGKLEFTCDEFLNWNNHLTMTYDSETNKIEIKNAT